MSNGKLEILCATMHQRDFSKIKEMNIACDVVFANQADIKAFDTFNFDGHTAKMLTTTTRGVGKNRNLALDISKGNILLFADDDVVYSSDMPEMVNKAFDELSDADVIVFGIESVKDGSVIKTKLPKTEKLPFWRSMKYGTCSIAVRRSALIKAELRFSELFGGGCIYSHGEDSDFIIQCYKRGLNVYSYHYILGSTKKDSSSCFEGFNEKYFYDKGALARHSFGFVGVPFLVYTAFKYRKKSELSATVIVKCLFAGYQGFADLISYTEWINE